MPRTKFSGDFTVAAGSLIVLNLTQREAREMLQTSYKNKLPHGWSYPMGAEELSEWLEGVEGAAQSPLHFSDYQIRNSRYRLNRFKDMPYQILGITYSRPLIKSDLQFLASRGQDDQWEVRVDPVPSEHRARIHACVVSEGLPQIRKWLEQTRILEIGQGRGFCRLLYQEGSQRIILERKQGGFGKVISTVLPCQGAV